VVLAGGRGTRLKPFTIAFPKPLVPVGDSPIIDVIVRQLRAAGITRITLAVGHLAELVMAYFDSKDYGDITIDYSRESQPLGTAGPLAQISDLDEPFVVVNGDILASLDFRDLIGRHRASAATATIAAYRKELQIDLGVLEVDESDKLIGYREKPLYHFDVSMGAYVFEPEVLEFLKPETRCDLPELVLRLSEAANHHLLVYRFEGFWLDIGRPDDYARAVEEYDVLEPLLFPES
jgi:NDP-sugar pyrophosphorylase family protein